MSDFFKRNLDEGRHEMNNWLSGTGKKVVLIAAGIIAVGIIIAAVMG